MSAKKTARLLFFSAALFIPGVTSAADQPTPDDLAQRVKTIKIVFAGKTDRDPKLLGK